MKIENIPGMLWQLHKSKYIRFKNIHFSLKKNSFQFNMVSYKFLSRNKIIFIITHEKKIRSSQWAHGDLLMSSLWVHSDQNAEPWPSREFTVIKMLTVIICFLMGFPHRSGSLHASSFAPFGTDFDHLVQKAICHKYKVTRIDHINWKCSWFSAQLLHNLC